MKRKNLLILGLTSAILLCLLIFAGMLIQTNEMTNNTTNDTNINLTLNDTNNTTENQVKENTEKSSTKNSKSKSPEIVSESEKYNYQADNGYYKEVEYSDGNFRQYDSNGKLIGSSYSSDQSKLPSMD